LIRIATAEDAGVIADIYNESIRAGDSTMDQVAKTSADVVSWFAQLSDRETILLFEAENGVLGWGIIKRYSDRPGYRFACETSVYVRRSAFGMGHGSDLQRALLETCKSFGYHHVVAKIWATNAASIALHQRFQFKIVGTQTEIGYADGQWIDVVIMQRHLN